MFTSIFDSVMKEASIAPFVSTFNEFVASLGMLFPLALIALCLIVGFFGRRLVDLVRVTLLFAIGFVASMYWIVPLVADMLPGVPGYAIGLGVGFVAALLSRLIYNGVYIGVIGFDTFNICFNGLFLAELTALTMGDFNTSIGVACAVTLVALMLRKYLEMLITAAAGGIGIAFFANQIYNYAASFNLAPMTTVIAVGAVFAFPMFLFQYRNRIIF